MRNETREKLSKIMKKAWNIFRDPFSRVDFSTALSMAWEWSRNIDFSNRFENNDILDFSCLI